MAGGEFQPRGDGLTNAHRQLCRHSFGTLSPDAPPPLNISERHPADGSAGPCAAKPTIISTTSQILHNKWKLYVENVKEHLSSEAYCTLLHEITDQSATTQAASR